MKLHLDPSVIDTEDSPKPNGTWWNTWLVRCENALLRDQWLKPADILSRMNLKLDDWEIIPFLEQMTETGYAVHKGPDDEDGYWRLSSKAEEESPRMLDLRSQINSRNEEIAALRKQIEEASAKNRHSGPAVISVTVNGTKTKTKQKLVHYQFEDALKYVTARTDHGYPVPTWFFGASGGGKSHMFRQIAQAIGFEDYVIRGLGPTDTLGSIVGYKNHLTGEFVPGMITPEMYGKGGFVAFDEVCNADPSVPIGLNDLIAGVDYRFANGKLVKKSKDFYLVASDNTNGSGSKNGFIRSKLDISSLTRFIFFLLEYDEVLENALSGCPAWTAYVQKVRKFVSENTPTAPVYITPRASINGASLLRAGISPKKVMDSTLFTHCSLDVKETIIANLGEYTHEKVS